MIPPRWDIYGLALSWLFAHGFLLTKAWHAL